MRTIILLVISFGAGILHADDTLFNKQNKRYTSITAAGVYENRSLFFNSLGAIVDVSNGWRIWSSLHTNGHFEIGAFSTYTIEPYSQMGNVYDFEKCTGASHRIQGSCKAGSVLYLPPKKKLIFGVHLFGGWAHVFLRGHLANTKYEVDGDYNANIGKFISGLIGTIGYRVTDKFAIVSRGSVTLLNKEFEVMPFYSVSLGCSFQIRYSLL